MNHPEQRDRDASQRSLRQAIDGLDAAPRRRAQPRPSALAQRLTALEGHMTPLRVTAVLVGVTLAALAGALI